MQPVDLFLPADRRQLQSSTDLSNLFTVVISAVGDEPEGFSISSEAELEVVETVGTNTSSTDAEEVTFTAPVYVCGDGVRATVEQCDDNNTKGGDGCSALCQVEFAWTCVSSTSEFGSGVGGIDTCSPVCGGASTASRTDSAT